MFKIQNYNYSAEALKEMSKSMILDVSPDGLTDVPLKNTAAMFKAKHMAKSIEGAGVDWITIQNIDSGVKTAVLIKGIGSSQTVLAGPFAGLVISGIEKSMNDSQKLDYFKKQLINILLNQQNKEVEIENNPVSEKSIIDVLDRLEKSYAPGTIRTWKGQKYIKGADKKWRRYFDKHTRGANEAVQNMVRKVRSITDMQELMNFVMANRGRFVDGYGHELPIVQQIHDAVEEKNKGVSKTVVDSNNKTIKDNKKAINDNKSVIAEKNETGNKEKIKFNISDGQKNLLNKFFDSLKNGNKLSSQWIAKNDLNNLEILPGVYLRLTDIPDDYKKLGKDTKKLFGLYSLHSISNGSATEDIDDQIAIVKNHVKNGDYEKKQIQELLQQKNSIEKLRYLYRGDDWSGDFDKFLNDLLGNNINSNKQNHPEESVSPDDVTIPVNEKKFKNVSQEQLKKMVSDAGADMSWQDRYNYNNDKIQIYTSYNQRDGYDKIKYIAMTQKTFDDMTRKAKEAWAKNAGKIEGLSKETDYTDILQDILGDKNRYTSQKVNGAILQHPETVVIVEGELEKHDNRSEAMKGNDNAKKDEESDKSNENIIKKDFTGSDKNNVLKKMMNPTEEMLNVEYSRENYNRYFPEGKIKTPIENVKISPHQFERLGIKDNGKRSKYIGALYQTLSKPDVIIDDIDKKNRHAKVYMKAFIGNQKNKYYFSIVPSIDGISVVISNGPRKYKEIFDKIKKASIFYYKAEGGSRTIGTGKPLPNDSNIPQTDEKSSAKPTNLDGIIGKYASDKQVKKIIDNINVQDFTSENTDVQHSKAMQGVFHKNGYDYATDGRLLAKIKSDYSANDEGYYTLKNGERSNDYEIPYERVIPANNSGSDVSAAFADIDTLMKRCIAGKTLQIKDGKGVQMKVGNSWFNPSMLLNVLAMAKKNNFTHFESGGELKPLKVYGDKDDSCIVLMPMHQDKELAYIDENGEAGDLSDEQKNKLSLGKEESTEIRKQNKMKYMSAAFSGPFSKIVNHLQKLVGMENSNLKLKYHGRDYSMANALIKNGFTNVDYDINKKKFEEKYGAETGDKFINAMVKMHEIYDKAHEMEADEKVHSNDLKEYLKTETDKLKQSLGIEKSLFDDFDACMMQKSLTYSGHPIKARENVAGMKVSIENLHGSTRTGTDKDGHKWHTHMNYDYGYIRGTEGHDGDQLDVYLNQDRPDDWGESDDNSVGGEWPVFIVHQNDPVTGKYDEDKCMIGWDTPEEAKQAYLSQYDRPGFFGSIDTMDLPTFKDKIFTESLKGKKIQKSLYR